MDLRQGTSSVRLGIVGLFALVTAFAGLWSLPPLDRDEARFAQATVQMLESEDYIVMRFQDRERNKKPAGIYWLQAASVKLFSSVESREIWVYRIPSMIGVVIAAIFTALAGARLFDGRTGFLAGLFIASAPLVAAEGTIAKTDGVLLGLICVAQFAFLTVYRRTLSTNTGDSKPTGWRWPLVFWLSQGAAILIKGPIAPLVALLTGAGLSTGRKRFGWIWPMRPITGVIILLLMISPWAYAIWSATEGRFFTEAIGNDMLGKVGNAQEGHAGGPGYHFILLWPLFWPATALVLSGFARAWGGRDQWNMRFLLAWIIPAWIVFELAGTKLPHYVMPLYPALAILAAYAATDIVRNTLPEKIGPIIYCVVGLIAAGLVAALPVFFSDMAMSMLCFGVSGVIALATIFITMLYWRKKSYEAGIASAVLASLYAWTLMTVILPSLSDLAVSPRMSTALELADRHPIRDNQLPVAIAGYSEPSAVFLLGTATKLTNAANAATLLKTGKVIAAIIEERHKQEFMFELAESPVKTLAVIDGLNYSNGKTVTLTIYIRSF
ncbi:ArnT family glycosyltransferase [Hyphococcus sp. DH-69]|uniref:ArnT family glycosyltransferase n=1 Tax=Hyphococcus formosus TaxID=3143534 RepID=UPI00398BA374